MNSDRIKEIQSKTAFPESQSVMLALKQLAVEIENKYIGCMPVEDCSECSNHESDCEYCCQNFANKFKQKFEVLKDINMKTNICEKCTYNNFSDKVLCSKCIRNPNITDMFKPLQDYYPLELKGTHIHLWEKDGSSKYTIAMFDYLENDECWELRFIGERPLDNRVDKEKFFELVQLGYKSLEGREEA